MLSFLVSVHCASFRSCIVSGPLLVRFVWRTGFGLGSQSQCIVLGVGGSSVEAWYTTALDIEEVLSGAVDAHLHVLVADVKKSFNTVNRGILDRVLRSLGLLAWFRHAYFEYHAHVRLQFKLAAGLGQPWTRDRGFPQGCPFSMMFIVALYLRRLMVGCPCCLISGEMLVGVVQRKGATTGSFDGWGWRELKVMPVAWFDGPCFYSVQG